MLSPHDAYQLWADCYPAVAHNPLMQIEQEIVEPLLAERRATRALDVGSGSGRYLPLLESTGASVVLAVDLSLAMLTRSAGRRRVCGDACRLPFRRGAFDVINASLMVGDVADLARWSREMARVLTAGGHLIYSDFHPSWAQRGWSRTFRDSAGQMHEVSFHPHTLEDHLEALEAGGFRVLAIREPRLKRDLFAAVKEFCCRRGNPQVLIVVHAVKQP
jgi:malonyl-CoA O-methyltransferase